MVGLEANPTNLDPRLATGAAAVRILPLLFNSLLRLDPAGEPAPELALSWETPSPTTYVFHLRPGVRFHDGRELTAADVRYTYDWMRDPKNHSPNLGALAVVAAIETPDPLTVRFVLKEPFASFLQNLTLGIVPAHLGDAKDFVDAPVGSGPFRWGEWRPGERLVVTGLRRLLGGAAAPRSRRLPHRRQRDDAPARGPARHHRPALEQHPALRRAVLARGAEPRRHDAPGHHLPVPRLQPAGRDPAGPARAPGDRPRGRPRPHRQGAVSSASRDPPPRCWRPRTGRTPGTSPRTGTTRPWPGACSTRPGSRFAPTAAASRSPTRPPPTARGSRWRTS